MQGRAGSWLCFPTLILRPLPVGLAASSAAGCAAHSSLSGVRSLPGTARQRGSPPLARGVQIRLLRVRGTAERLPPPFVLLADPARHGHHAADGGTRLSRLQRQQGAAEYLAGLARAKRGVRRGCSPRWRTESGHSGAGSPPPSAMHRPHCREGANLPSGSRGLPTMLFGSPVSPGCSASPFPLRRVLSCLGKALPVALLGQLCPRQDLLAPKQWEAFEPFDLGSAAVAAGACCPPASQSLVLSSPELNGAETHWDLPVLHGESGPEALFSRLPRGPYPHPPLQTPREAPACKPCLPREGTRGCVLGEGMGRSRGSTGGGICPPASPPGWPRRFGPSLRGTLGAGTPRQALLKLRGSLETKME